MSPGIELSRLDEVVNDHLPFHAVNEKRPCRRPSTSSYSS